MLAVIFFIHYCHKSVSDVYNVSSTHTCIFLAAKVSVCMAVIPSVQLCIIYRMHYTVNYSSMESIIQGGWNDHLIESISYIVIE